jgi:hypothetical protein
MTNGSSNQKRAHKTDGIIFWKKILGFDFRITKKHYFDPMLTSAKYCPSLFKHVFYLTSHPSLLILRMQDFDLNISLVVEERAF